MTHATHPRLVTTGPVDVRPEILEAQTHYMIGHRGKAFEELFASVHENMKKVFMTENRIYMISSSGTGFWEGASRNCIRDGKKALHFASGAFSDRWVKVSKANGKDVDVVEVDWGTAIKPDMVAEALEKDSYDALCIVHNETSTGVTNPIGEIAEVVRQYDETLFMVDTVSGVMGAEFRTDDWGVDVALSSSQKAFSLPPGLAMVAVSDKALARAEEIEHRGYYFDFLQLEKYIKKNNTPSTPPIALLYAADAQLKDIVSNGLENRWQHHLQLRDLTHEWALSRGFALFAEEGYRSPTLTTIDNKAGSRTIDVFAMADYMAERGFSMDKGYGKIKGETFRIGHMGDFDSAKLEDVLAGLDNFIEAN